MLKFSEFVSEAKVDPTTGKRIYSYRNPNRRSKSSVSASRERFLQSGPRSKEDVFKSKLPEMSDQQKQEHVNKHFKWETINKVTSSSHDPHAPIDMTRPIPDSVKALARAITYHFEDGIRKKTDAVKYDHYPSFEAGHNQVRAATYAMSKYIGKPYRDLLVSNETRPVLKKLISKNE